MNRRVVLVIEYDGTAYAGWQRQDNAFTVQQAVEEALFSLTGERVSIIGAGRTDAGVHAVGQTAHFDTQSGIPPRKFFLALNTRLPPDIRIRESCGVSPSFHARYHATGKEYSYLIHNAFAAPALERNRRYHVPQPLDVEAMSRAVRAVIGMHDFSGLCAAGSAVRDKVRIVRAAVVERDGELITLTIEGNGFLYNMVRIIAGTLVAIGKGKLTEDALERAVAERNRLLAGPTAPAHGLCLCRVAYMGNDVLLS